MPPKRTASKRQASESPVDSEDSPPGSDFEEKPKKKVKASAKRKAAASDDEAGPSTAKGSKAKKAKTSEATEETTKGLAPNGQPTNKVMPVHVEFPQRDDNVLRIATWNICGLAASSKKGFKYYVEAEDADILILTETKVNNDPLDPVLSKRYPHRYWSISAKKTYSGTAICSKIKPLSIDYTLPGHPDPEHVKGRIVTLEFAKAYVVGTYVTNAGTGLKTLPEKNTWNKHLHEYLHGLDAKKPVIWAGDMNVAPKAIDLANPKTNWNKTPGYTEDETSAFERVLNPPEDGANKMVDVWRHLHPETQHYTYFSYRFNCRMKGIGWRLDHFVTSKRLLDEVKMCEIRSEIYGASDHCPVVLEIDKASLD